MLIRGLTQFNISLAYNEDTKGRKEEFIGYAQAYHLRGNIENGFRDQKRSFMILNRTRIYSPAILLAPSLYIV
ncbi:MAG: hypothetical protein ACTSRZ_08385 [Promethearchaeota archaeon]